MLQEQGVARRQRKRSGNLLGWHATADAVCQELSRRAFAEELEAFDAGVTAYRQSLGDVESVRRPWSERPNQRGRQRTDAPSQKGKQAKGIGVRPMEVVEQQKHRLDAPALKKAQHAIEAGGTGIVTDNDWHALGLNRALAAEVIEGLAEDPEWEGDFRGIAVAGTHHETGSGHVPGMVEHRCLSQPRLGDKEERPAPPSPSLVQRRADRRHRGFALPNRMPQLRSPAVMLLAHRWQ